MGARARQRRGPPRIPGAGDAPLHLDAGSIVNDGDRLIPCIALWRAGLACLRLRADAERLRANCLGLVAAAAEFRGVRCASGRRFSPCRGRRSGEQHGKETK
jgi:hypothetical protein